MKTLATLVWCAGACALALGQQNKTSAAAVTGLPPADVTAIRAASKSYTDLVLARDWPKWIKLFTDDAIDLPPHETAKHGPKEIEAWAKTLPSIKTLVVEPIEFTGGGGLAVVRGRYSFTMAGATGQSDLPDAGKYVEVWRKQPDGAWKLFRDIWNSDLPLPAGDGAASAATDPWLGAWVLNLAKTRINPGPASKGETRTYTSTANGERATYDEIQADGKRVYSTSTYRFDGQDAKVIGNPDSNTQAIQRTGPRSIASVIKKDGKVVRTATRMVSEDGKTLTVEFKGTNSRGQPIIEEKWVFDRRDEPWLGSWETNLATSRISANAIPKFDLRTFTPTAQGEHAAYVTIESDGKPVYSQCDITYDGVDRSVVGGEPGETLAFTRAGPRALAVTSKRNGKVSSIGTRAVSEDGKTLTVTVKQADTSGGRTDELWVLERRGDSQSPEDFAAAIKTAVVQHWAAINGNDNATVDRQHTSGISVFLADLEPRMRTNSPAWLGAVQKWQGAKFNWTLRDVEVQPLGSAAAAASFYMDGSIRWANGALDSRPRRVTEIWVNDNGTWKEAHHHDSVYAAAGKTTGAQ